MTPLACDVDKAHSLVKLLVLDGRHADARVFGDRYVAQCGDDAFVDNWAKAPQPHRHDPELQLVGYVHFHDGDRALMVDASGAGHIVDVASVDADPLAIEARPPAASVTVRCPRLAMPRRRPSQSSILRRWRGSWYPSPACE